MQITPLTSFPIEAILFSAPPKLNISQQLYTFFPKPPNLHHVHNDHLQVLGYILLLQYTYVCMCNSLRLGEHRVTDNNVSSERDDANS